MLTCFLTLHYIDETYNLHLSTFTWEDFQNNLEKNVKRFINKSTSEFAHLENSISSMRPSLTFLLLFSFGSAQWFLPFFQFIQQCMTFIILISLISLCITVIYVPVLSPLLGTMRVRIRTEIWLISRLRAPSVVISTINTAEWLDACDLCLPVEATARLWPSAGGLQGSVLGWGTWPQSGNWTAAHKCLCWLWPHTHLTFLFSVSSLNLSSALFYFPPFAIFVSKTHSTVVSPWLLKQITFGGIAVVFKFISTECYSKLVVTTRTHYRELKGTPLHSLYC